MSCIQYQVYSFLSFSIFMSFTFFLVFTLSFLLHFPCNSLHISCQHFQMIKLVYHVPISCTFPNLHQVSKMSYIGSLSHFPPSHHATMFSMFISMSTIHNFHIHHPIQQLWFIAHIRHIWHIQAFYSISTIFVSYINFNIFVMSIAIKDSITY